MDDVLHAIKYMHDLEVAHRDIKPENIVMSNVNIFYLFRVYVNFVILDGLLCVKVVELLYVEQLIMLLLKFWKENNMV